jgi:hypothetical protein
MGNLFNFIDNNKLIQVIVTTIITGTYAYFVVQKNVVLKNFFKKKENEVSKKVINKKEKFFESLFQGLKSNIINSISDIENIYQGITDLSSESSNYDYNMLQWLKEFLVKLMLKDFDEDLSNDTYNELKDKTTIFIKEYEESSPFSNLPEREKNLFNDLLLYLNSDKINNEHVKTKLKELNSIFQTKVNTLDKLERINKWSVPLSITGLILTIVFGLLSIIT